MKDDYTKRIENVVKQMLQPLKDVPFNLIIETVSGKKVMPFDKNNSKHLEVLNILEQIAKNTGKKMNEAGILRPRPNEVGNDIEKYVKNAFSNLNLKAEIPEFLEPNEDVYPIIKTFLRKADISIEQIDEIEILSTFDAKPKLSSSDSKKLKNILRDTFSSIQETKNIKYFYAPVKNLPEAVLKEKIKEIRNKFLSKKATGYPDIIFWYKDTPYYLECKTYNFKNIDTTQRSFYFSPSENFKLIHDTTHFMLSFEIYIDGESGANHIYKCKHYKILSIESLSLDVKHEFNSDNKRIYSGREGSVLLAEGKV